jgi:hypothetical protein
MYLSEEQYTKIVHKQWKEIAEYLKIAYELNLETSGKSNRKRRQGNANAT